MEFQYGREKWRDEAACADEETSLFYPAGTSGPAAEQISEAKAICASCEVREECLIFALRTGEDYGIWGGTTEEERRSMREQWSKRRGA